MSYYGRNILRDIGIATTAGLAGALISSLITRKTEKEIITDFAPDIIISKKDNTIIAVDSKQNVIAKDTSMLTVLKESINAIKDNGGTIYIKHGIYSDEGMVNVSGNIRIIGDGMELTILKGIGFSHESKPLRLQLIDLTLDFNNVDDVYLNLFYDNQKTILKRVALKNSSNQFLMHWRGVVKAYNSYFIDGGTSVAKDNIAGATTFDDDISVFDSCILIKTQNSKGGSILSTGATKKLIIRNSLLLNYQPATYALLSFENYFGDIIGDIIVSDNMLIDLSNPDTVKYNNLGNESDKEINGIVRGNLFIGHGLAIKGYGRIIVDSNLFINILGSAIVYDTVIEPEIVRISNNTIVNANTLNLDGTPRNAIEIYDMIGDNKLIVDSNKIIGGNVNTGIHLNEARGLGTYTPIVVNNVVRGIATGIAWEENVNPVIITDRQGIKIVDSLPSQSAHGEVYVIYENDRWVLKVYNKNVGDFVTIG